MLASIAQIVEQFKQNWTQELTDQAIEKAMRPFRCQLTAETRSAA